MDYQLIALDIDGTLLNSRKEIPPEAAQAIRTVVAAGKTVVFATGRAVSELPALTSRLPEVRYAVYASGAGLYDIWEGKTFGLQPVPAARMKEIHSELLERQKELAGLMKSIDANLKEMGL